ncbi:MAG: hypothetical protein AAF067_08215, partial [Pseudomonadota bacterium]
MAAMQSEEDQAFDFLLNKETVVRTLNDRNGIDSDNAMSLALKHRDFSTADILLDKGCDINTDSTIGMPFLIEAMKSNDAEMIDF